MKSQKRISKLPPLRGDVRRERVTWTARMKSRKRISKLPPLSFEVNERM